MHRPPRRRQSLTRDGAETIASRALLFLAEDAGRLGRFLSLTGIGPGELQSQADTPELLAAVLGHLLEDESMLLVFTAGAGIPPEDVHAARHLLGGASPWEST